MKSFVTPLMFLFVALWLTGCATPVATQVSRMEAQAASPLDFEQINYRPLPASGKTKLAICSDLPVVLVGEDRSYVVGFELPEENSGLLAIRSFFNGSAYKQNYATGQLTAQYMHPYVVLLDAGYAPVLDGEPALHFVLGSMFGEQADHFMGWVPVPENAAYLVILSDYADPIPMAETTRHSSQAYMIGNTPVVSQSSQKMVFERSPEGQLKLFWDEFEEDGQ